MPNPTAPIPPPATAKSAPLILTQEFRGWLVKFYGSSFDGKDKIPEAFFTNVVSDVLYRSLRTCDPNITEADLPVLEKTSAQVDTPIDKLRILVCQMRHPKMEDGNFSYVHEKMLSVLKTLESYSWCSKAVLALAAFVLEFGIFWDLYEQKKESAGTKDSLGYWLAVLDHVEVFDTTKMSIVQYIDVVKYVYKMVHCIVCLERLRNTPYGSKISSLVEFMKEAHHFVYWIIFTIIVLFSQFDVFYGGAPYNLTDIRIHISQWYSKLEAYKKDIENEIGRQKEYDYRENGAFLHPTDILHSLTCLLFPLDKKNEVYDERSVFLVKTTEEVFKEKYVVVFISGLSDIEDEINLLKRIYEDLKPIESEKDKKDFPRGHVKILWAPIVDEESSAAIDDTATSALFDELRRKMTWHVVNYKIIPQICKALIKNRLKFDHSKPVAAVYDPNGNLLNDNAFHVLFTWGAKAFPWRPSDYYQLSKESYWLWTELTRRNPQIKINDWINEDNYIIGSGPTESDSFNNEWMMKIPVQLQTIRNDSIITKFQINIRDFRHGEKDKDENETSQKFWTFVQNTYDTMNKDQADNESFKQVKRLLGFRRDKTGWVILSKGANVKRICQAKQFLQTLTEFTKWKNDIEKDSGFDESLLRHYDSLTKPPVCSHLTLTGKLSDMNPTSCPECNHLMKFKSAEFFCCHEFDVPISK